MAHTKKNKLAKNWGWRWCNKYIFVNKFQLEISTLHVTIYKFSHECMSFVITMRISISHRFFSINFRHFRFKSLKFLPFSFTVEIHFVDDFFSSSFMLLHASFMFFSLTHCAVSVNSIYVKRKKENHLVAIFICFCAFLARSFWGLPLFHYLARRITTDSCKL